MLIPRLLPCWSCLSRTQRSSQQFPQRLLVVLQELSYCTSEAVPATTASQAFESDSHEGAAARHESPCTDSHAIHESNSTRIPPHHLTKTSSPDTNDVHESNSTRIPPRHLTKTSSPDTNDLNHEPSSSVVLKAKSTPVDTNDVHEPSSSAVARAKSTLMQHTRGRKKAAVVAPLGVQEIDTCLRQDDGSQQAVHDWVEARQGGSGRRGPGGASAHDGRTKGGAGEVKGVLDGLEYGLRDAQETRHGDSVSETQASQSQPSALIRELMEVTSGWNKASFPALQAAVGRLSPQLKSLSTADLATLLEEMGALFEECRKQGLPLTRDCNKLVKEFVEQIMHTCFNRGLKTFSSSEVCQMLTSAKLLGLKVQLRLFEDTAALLISRKRCLPVDDMTGCALSYALSGSNPLGGRYMDMMLDHMTQERALESWTPANISMGIRAVAHLGHKMHGGDAIPKLARAVVSQQNWLESSSPYNLALTLWLISRLRSQLSHDMLTECADKVAQEIVHRMSQQQQTQQQQQQQQQPGGQRSNYLDRGAMAMVMAALGEMLYNPLGGQLCTAVVQRIRKDLEFFRRSSLRGITGVVVGLARVQHKIEPELLDSLFPIVCDKVKDYDWEAMANAHSQLFLCTRLMWACTALGHNPMGGAFFDLVVHQLLRHPRLSRELPFLNLIDFMMATAKFNVDVPLPVLSDMWHQALTRITVQPHTFTTNKFNSLCWAFEQHRYLPGEMIVRCFVNDFVSVRIHELGLPFMQSLMHWVVVSRVRLHPESIHLLDRRARSLGGTLQVPQGAHNIMAKILNPSPGSNTMDKTLNPRRGLRQVGPAAELAEAA